MAGAEELIFNTVNSLLRRRNAQKEVTADADFFADLELDSLEVAELSVVLEEEFGTDPYTEGLNPRTIRDVAAFYAK